MPVTGTYADRSPQIFVFAPERVHGKSEQTSLEIRINLIASQAIFLTQIGTKICHLLNRTPKVFCLTFGVRFILTNSPRGSSDASSPMIISKGRWHFCARIESIVRAMVFSSWRSRHMRTVPMSRDNGDDVPCVALSYYLLHLIFQFAQAFIRKAKQFSMYVLFKYLLNTARNIFIKF